MTSARQSATLYREGAELDDLLAELDEAHPGQVRVVDVTYGREGGVLGFFAKRRVGVRYALDAEAEAYTEAYTDSRPDSYAHSPVEVDAAIEPDEFDGPPTGRHSASPLADLLTAAEAAEAEAMVTRGVAPEGGSDQPNVEFARLLLDLAMNKAKERRATEDAARAAFVESGTHVRAATEPELQVPAAVRPVAAPAAPAAPAPAALAAPVAPVAPAAPIARPARVAPAPPAPEAPVAQEIWTAPPRPVPAVTAPVPRAAARRAAVADPTPDREAVALADLLRTVRTRPVGAHRAASDAGARTEFTLRRQLAELGVPISWIPDGAADAYWAIEQLCARLPAAPSLDLAPGAVVVVAGPAVAAQEFARALCAEHRLNPGVLATAGCNSGDLPARRDVTQRWQARKLADEARAARREPVIVAVNTDAADAESATWAAGIIAELAPDTMWTVADATRKPSDLRRLLAGLGRPSDALIAVNAARTASPASVWELAVPVATIDGRPATRGAWAALLIDGLAALEN